MDIPKTGGGTLVLDTKPGTSIVIIGANGSGKTRLSVHIEKQLTGKPVLRLTAQKSLVVNDTINLIALERAEKSHEFGNEDGSEGSREVHRYGSKPAVHPVSDFDALLQRLFAERAARASDHLDAHRKNTAATPPSTHLDDLITIWTWLLPHRLLSIEAPVSIKVRPAPASDAKADTAGMTANAPAATVGLAKPYPGSEMSDGERAIFYFLGQCLVAREKAVLIVDEPEGHVHKATLGPLWDAIEKARPDCTFIYITHSLDFALTRPAAAKYYIRSYVHHLQSWDIAVLPKDTGLPEDVVAEIVGSRRPILFVEGDRGSLDFTLYRHQYAGFTVVPIGSCADVIHAVSTYNHSGALHWFDAKGLVDADHRSAESIAGLLDKHVHVLPVAEVENLLLLPDVFSSVAEALMRDPAECLAKLKEKVLKVAKDQVEGVSVRYTARRLDESLKRVAHAASDLPSLEASYKQELAGIDPASIYQEFRQTFAQAIADSDLELVLKLFDNKTLPSLAAGVLNLRDNSQELMERVKRQLGDKANGEKLRAALTKYLPNVQAATQSTAVKKSEPPPPSAVTATQPST